MRTNHMNVWKSMRPKLARRDAIRPPINFENEEIRNKEYIDFNILQIYSDKYLYNNYYCHIVINDYLPHVIPRDINNICFKYYFQPKTATFGIAYKLWNNRLTKIKNKSKTFSGRNLISNLLKLNQSHNPFNLNQLIKTQCKNLIENKFIEKCDRDREIKIKIKKYNFTANSIIEFQEYRKYLRKRDRKSWNIGTVIQVKSYTYKSWMPATIISIKNDNSITVVFGKNGNITKKTVTRYDYKSTRSTPQYIDDRKKLSVLSFVKIYDGYTNRWYYGRIKRNLNDKYNEMLQIEYKSINQFNLEPLTSKIVSRWSSEIKIIPDPEVDLKFGAYQEGNHCNVWSHTQNCWLSATIKMVIPMNDCILVKYGGYQKVIHVSNSDIVLV